jgi:hypothetical protein
MADTMTSQNIDLSFWDTLSLGQVIEHTNMDIGAATIIRTAAFWGVATYSGVGGYRWFGETSCLHLHGWTLSQSRRPQSEIYSAVRTTVHSVTGCSWVSRIWEVLLRILYGHWISHLRSTASGSVEIKTWASNRPTEMWLANLVRHLWNLSVAFGKNTRVFQHCVCAQVLFHEGVWRWIGRIWLLCRVYVFVRSVFGHFCFFLFHLVSALDGNEWSHSRSGRFAPAERTVRSQIDKVVSGPQNQSEHCEYETNLLSLSGIESRFLGRLAHSVVSYPRLRLSNFHTFSYVAPVFGKSGQPCYIVSSFCQLIE